MGVAVARPPAAVDAALLPDVIDAARTPASEAITAVAVVLVPRGCGKNTGCAVKWVMDKVKQQSFMRERNTENSSAPAGLSTSVNRCEVVQR